MLHEGNEDQGKYGKQCWSIARRCIAIAMDQGRLIKIGRQIFPDKFVWNEFEQLRWPEGRRAGSPE